MKYTYHVDGTQPTDNAYFVFGSNEAGRHGAGAALAAAKNFGAEYGNGYGFQGRSFAIPTKDYNIQTLPLSEVEHYVGLFLLEALGNPNAQFFMTRIGCGLAGYADETIAPLFVGAPTNINFPEEWSHILEA